MIALTIVAIVLTAYTGNRILVGCLERGRSPASMAMYWGLGLPVGVVAVSVALRMLAATTLTLQLSAGLVLFAMGAYWATSLYRRSNTNWQITMTEGFSRCSQTIRTRPLLGLVIALMLFQWALVLTNNWLRPIFPWDAFTTWMYRAKAWVLTDQLLPFDNTATWFAEEGSAKFAIYAQHYPAPISVFAAFCAGLTGEWSAAAASLPWTAALLALAAGMFGVLRKTEIPVWLSLLGAYGLTSLPLMGAHAALAGYGDIWLALSSGMGLTVLIHWWRNPDRNNLLLAMLLLIAGTQLKLEGWLWLLLGLAFVSARETLTRFGIRGVAILLLTWLAIGGRFVSSKTDLGLLGIWGMTDEHISAGPLGQYALRPYNPLPNYFSALFEHPNFHLLGVAVVFGLVALTAVQRTKAAPFWLMTTLVAASQWFIFGVSAYSTYAETGTAINRLLLQFAPVFVFVAINGINAVCLAAGSANGGFSSIKSTTWALLLTASSLLMTIVISLGLGASDSERNVLKAQHMQPVLGTIKNTERGVVFLDSSGPVGVLRAPLITADLSNSQYVTVDVESDTDSPVNFYWINYSRPQTVHSVTLPASGPNVISLPEQTAWHPEDVKELGIIVPAASFSKVYLRSVVFDERLHVGLIDHAMKQWQQFTGPTQISLNKLQEPRGVFPSATAIITLCASFALALVLVGTIALPQYANKLHTQLPANTKLTVGVVRVGLMTAAFFWLIVDFRWLGELNYWATLAGPKAAVTPSLASHAGQHLLPSVKHVNEQLLSTTNSARPIAVVPASLEDSFEAQKLPFLLLPYSAFSLTSSGSMEWQNWTGPVAIVGKNQSQLLETADVISTKSGGRLVTQAQTDMVVFMFPR